MPPFPPTRISVVEDLASSDEIVRDRARDRLARAYRDPVVAVLRHRWHLDPNDAEDIAQGFFLSAFSKEWFGRFDPTRGRFRSFLRSCLFAYASTAHETAQRVKRGGAVVHVDVDISSEELMTPPEVEAIFDREWARSVLAMAIDALRVDCENSTRTSAFEIFVAREIDGAEQDDPPTYSELGQRFALPVTQVTNHLTWARHRFRSNVLDVLRSLTATDQEFREEARALLGIEAPCD